MKIFWLGIPITEKAARKIAKEKKVCIPDGAEFFGRKCKAEEFKFCGIKEADMEPLLWGKVENVKR